MFINAFQYITSILKDAMIMLFGVYPKLVHTRYVLFQFVNKFNIFITKYEYEHMNVKLVILTFRSCWQYLAS